MTWIEVDGELEAAGWNLLLIRSHDQWHCHYSHVAYLPCTGSGLDMVQVIEEAQEKIREGK